MKFERADNNPFKTSEKKPFLAGSMSLHFFLKCPYRMKNGFILWCYEGEAEISVNMQHIVMRKYTEIIILPQDIVYISRISDDIDVRSFAFATELLSEACFRMGNDFFPYIKEKFYFRHTEKSFAAVNVFVNLFETVYQDDDNCFQTKIATNCLQSYLLVILDKISKRADANKTEDTDRQLELFKRFARLVETYGATHRNVTFYAGELSVSARYLSKITQKIDNITPKEFIDNFAILEIKSLLQYSDLSLQQIADDLNFASLSNMGYYFKLRTDVSLSEFRRQRFA
jgi:AraC-like DNA-binding protein